MGWLRLGATNPIFPVPIKETVKKPCLYSTASPLVLAILPTKLTRRRKSCEEIGLNQKKVSFNLE